MWINLTSDERARRVYPSMAGHVMDFDMIKIRSLLESRDLPIQMLQPSVNVRITNQRVWSGRYS